jgi:hypothetical protein
MVQTGTRLGPYEIVGPLGAGGPPPLAGKLCASYGEVSSAFAAKRLRRDRAEAQTRVGGPKRG